MKKAWLLFIGLCGGFVSTQADVVSVYFPNGAVRVYFGGAATENKNNAYVTPGSLAPQTVGKGDTASFALAPVAGLGIKDWKYSKTAVNPKWQSLGVTDSVCTWTGLSDDETAYYLTVDLAWYAYALNFDLNGGNGSRKALSGLCYTNQVALPLNDAYTKFSKTGHSFSGWSASADGGVDFADGEEVNGARLGVSADGDAVTLYAVWTPNAYRANLDCALQGAECSTNVLSVTYGQPYGDMPVPKRQGYAFDGWYTAKSGGSRVTAETKVGKTEDHALYAHWTANTYVVKTTTAGGGRGDVTGAGSYAYATDTWLEAVPAVGSRFVRWSDGVTTAKRQVTVNAHANYEAVFEAITYGLQYVCNGGADGDANPRSATYGTAFAVADPVWTGRSFTGWSLSNGVGAVSATARHGASAETLGEIGVNVVKGGGGKTWLRDLATNDEATVTLYANWELLKSKVVLSHPGNKTSGLAGEVTVVYGVKPNDLGAVPSFGEGYTFGGYWQGNGQGEDGRGECLWDADGRATTAWDDLARWPAPSNVTVHAWKKARSYTLVLHPDAQIGANTASLACENGVPVRLPATNAYETADRTFLGWARNKDAAVPDFEKGALVWGSASGLPVNADNAPIDLYAIWRNERHQLSFNVDGGEALPSVQVTNGTTFACLAGWTPVKEDNAFLRWETASGAVVDTNSVVALAGDAMLYAVWSNANPTVTFKDGDDDAHCRRQAFDALNAVTLRTNEFVRAGHVFRGWGFSAEDVEPAYLDGATVVTNRSFTLHALWDPLAEVPRRVVFRANGGVGAPAPLEDVTGDFITMPTNILERGDLWTFGGWSTNSNANGETWITGKVVRVADLPFNSDKTAYVYAVWNSKLTELSHAVDCDNLILQTGEGQVDPFVPNYYLNPWKTTDVEDAFSCVSKVAVADGDNSALWAKVSARGMLAFAWKKSQDDDGVFGFVYGIGGNNPSYQYNFTIGVWTFSTNVVEAGYTVDWLTLERDAACYIDHVVWWPDRVSVWFVADGVEGYPREIEYDTLGGTNWYGNANGVNHGLPTLPEGYAWYAAEDGLGEKITNDSLITNQYVVLYAHKGQSAVDDVTITFKTNNVDYATATCVSNQSSVVTNWPAPPTPTNGAVFAGWYAGAEQMTLASTYVTNLVLKARWADEASATNEEGRVTTFWLDGARTRAWHKRTYGPGGTYASWPEDPVREGHVFAGWWTEADGGDRVESHYAVSAEHFDFFVRWVPVTNRAEVAFMANAVSGESPWKTATFQAEAAANATYGEAGDWPAGAPARAGYAFVGWCADPNGGAEVAADTPFDGLLTKLYASWRYAGGSSGPAATPVQNDPKVVTFFVNDGSSDDVWTTISCPTGFPFGAYAAWPTPSRGERWEFLGWFKTAVTNGTEAAVSSADLVWENTNLYAQWRASADCVSVVFNPQGGSLDGAADVWTDLFCDDVVSASAWPQPTRAGYAFVGWSTSSDVVAGEIVSDDSWRVPEGGATLYAVWREAPGDSGTGDSGTGDSGSGDSGTGDSGSGGSGSDDPVPPDVVDPDLLFMGNTTYNGWTCDADGALSGLLTVKAGKAASAKKGGRSKLTIAYTPFGGKKQSIKLPADAMPVTNQMALVDIPGIGRVRLSASQLEGVDCNAYGAADLTKSKDKTVKNDAKAKLAAKAGTWTAALGTDWGFVTFSVTVDKNGKGKLSGSLPDGTSVSLSSQGVLAGDDLAIPFLCSKKWKFGFLFCVDGTGVVRFTSETPVASPTGESCTVGGKALSANHDLADGPHEFTCEDLDVAQPFETSGKKWTFPKHVKKPKDGEEDPNPASVKLTYTAKTGVVKGSFSAVPADGAKAVTFTVRGIVVDGCVYGTGYNRKYGSHVVFAH